MSLCALFSKPGGLNSTSVSCLETQLPFAFCLWVKDVPKHFTEELLKDVQHSWFEEEYKVRMYLFWPGDWQLGKHIFSQGPTQKYRNPESWTLSEKPSCLVRRRALVMAYARGFTEEKCYFFPLVNFFYLIYLWYLKNVLIIIGYLLNKAEGKDLCKALHDSQLPVGEVWWNWGLRGSLCTVSCHETEGHLVSR